MGNRKTIFADGLWRKAAGEKRSGGKGGIAVYKKEIL